MAVNKEALESRLLLLVQVGLDEQDKPILRTRSFSRVKPEVTDEDLHALALALADLQEHELYQVRRVDDSELLAQP